MNDRNKSKVHALLKKRANTLPDKPFIYYQDSHVSYEKMDEISDRLAYSLLQLGISKGDMIAVVAPNQPEWLYTFFAAVKIGAPVVALNVRYRLAEFDYMLNNSQAKALVCIDSFGEFDFRQFFKENRSRFPSVEKYIYITSNKLQDDISLGDLCKTVVENQSLLEQAKQEVDETDTAIIIYTSGTTGKPKGAMISNKNILASASAQVEHFNIQATDVFIGSLPLNHVGGITCAVTSCLICGGSVVLIPSFRPDLVLQASAEYGITIMAGVPTMYVMMLNVSGIDKYDLSSVRYCIAGGSNVEPQLCTAISKTFPGAKLLNLYGLSETSGACVLSSLDDGVEKVSESIGVVIDNFKVKVVDGNGNELPAEQIGELVFKGDCVISGYLGMEKETADNFRNGWVYTGDMGYIDNDGHIYLKGRKKEMYIQGGFNVYPVEIENVLTRHPKVAMAAGFGVPDPVFGEVGRFYIVTKPGEVLTEEELFNYCKQNLADYKIPKQFEFADDLPLTPAGKIHKSLLKEKYLAPGGC
ncbi:class I adenylate-forming enzyme family protein [Desulfotruncus alcoholivorax]|uniref:class I adenylate-forming enzyme family protein n=1 Tax=Desulfotruncus alcoholivorax TaxID=265477 RepID=UPI0003F7CD9F|nr:AMP-binding protein [Desulfotruncus alcoholivorax]